MLPVINMHVDSAWVRGLLIFISFAAQIVLTVCLIFKLKREEASNELEKAAIWYQVAARIAVSFAFAVITHAKEQTASFWTNAGKLLHQ